MIAQWMLYSVVVSGFLGGAAFFVERTLRTHRREARWAWGLAMSASVALSIWGFAGMKGWLGAVGSGGVAGGTGYESAPAGLEALSLDALLALLPPQGMLERLDTPLIVAWVLASLMALAVVGVGAHRIRRRLAGWLRKRVEGEPVLVSPGFGPALVGLIRPRIVLPAWTLALARERLAIVLLHEREHRAARDLWAVTGAFLVVALLPWNPALWWQMSRLRLAVEADCDRRVLRRGVSPAGYGRLLLEVGQGGRSRGLMAAALMEPPSQLERRLKMMMKTERGWIASLGMLAAGALLLVAACETPAPTGTLADEALLQKASDEALHSVLEQEAGDMAFGEGQEEHERAKAQFEKQAHEDELAHRKAQGHLDEIAEGQEIRGQKIRINASAEGDADLHAEPLVVVDGVILAVRGKAALEGLNHDNIASVTVLKGDAAVERYGSDGADGVIQIATKAGAGG